MKEFIEKLRCGKLLTGDSDGIIDILYFDLYLMYNIKIEGKVISKYEFEICIYNNQNKHCFEINHNISMLINRSGFFVNKISFLYKNGDIVDIRADEMKEELLYNENLEYIKLYLNSGYTDGEYTNIIDCPDKLYTITQNSEEKIKKWGLFKDLKDKYNGKRKTIIFDKIPEGDNVVEIDCSIDKLFLHSYPEVGGYFTYDYIKPENIKLFIVKI